MADHGERRKERRYIVVGMDVCLGGKIYPIIDISRSAVRLLKSRANPTYALQADIVLRVEGRTRSIHREYTVRGWFIRGTNIDAVFGYEPPTKQWEATLRAHDTFNQTRLMEI